MTIKVGSLFNQLICITLCATFALPVTAAPTNEGKESQNNFLLTETDLQNEPASTILATIKKVDTATESQELVLGVATNTEEERRIEELLKKNLEQAQKTNPNLEPRLVFVDQDGPQAETNEAELTLSSDAKNSAEAIAPKNHQKISFSKRVSSFFKTAAADLKTTWREDPSLIVYTLVRGTVNGAFTAWSMHRYQHVSMTVAALEGMIILAQSGTLMYKVNFYLKWLTSSKNEFVRFAKGDALELAYLFLPQMLLFLTGQQTFEGLKSLGNYALSATMGTAQQEPMDGAISEAQTKLQRWVKRGDVEKREQLLKHGVRAASLLVSLLEIAVATGQMIHLPMAKEGFYILAASGWGVYLYQRGLHKKIMKVAFDFAESAKQNSEKFLKENSCRGTLGLL